LHTAAENDRSTRRQKKQLLNLVILSEAKDLLWFFASRNFNLRL
jgi:hypothetical protein